MQNLRPLGAANAPSGFAQRLASYARLTGDDIRQIDDGLGAPRAEMTPREVDLEHVAHPRISVVSQGWVGLAALLPDGRRQIVDLLMPGDHWDARENAVLGLTSYALTPVRLRDGAALLSMVAPGRQDYAIARAWQACVEAARARVVRHLVRLGRMAAYERMSDLLLELHERQMRAGLVDRPRVLMPLTQETLADYLGLSVVHVNRVMQQLRRDKLIDYGAGRIMLADLDHLRAIAPFSVAS